MAHPARRLHQRLETIHAVTYFSEESHAAATDLGLKGFWMGYFAFRAAPLGTVRPPVVEAVFANFAPRRVRRALPDAWSFTSPEACLEARRDSAVAALRRVAPEELAAAPWVVDHLAEIVERADHLGRPLFAANREQGVPDEPVAALWHLATCLREQRGDGHVAVQAASGLDPVEMHLIYAAGSGPPGELLRTTRDWTEEEWAAGVERLIERGVLSDETTLTAEGEALHRHIEDTTDALAARSLGEVDDLVEGLTPLARAISGSGVLPFPNPVGLPEA